MAICSEDADIFHSIQTKPPFSVWSKAFFTIFITASISQLRSQTKSVDSSPERIISFSSCPARKRKLFLIRSIISDIFSVFLSITIVPASNFEIFNRFCTNVSILSSSCSERSANSLIVGRFSASPCKIPL